MVDNSAPSARDTRYTSTQYALNYAPGIERHFWNIARTNIVHRHLLTALRAQSRHDAVILDVGCGLGIAVSSLRAKGLNCRGVELGSPYVLPDVEPYVTTGEDACRLPETLRRSVGTILLLDVVEHIEKPIDFLRDLREAYPALEHVLVTVPARQELWSNYDEYFGHFRRYDRGSLTALASASDLEVVMVKYFFNALYPAMYLANRRAEGRAVETVPPGSAVARLIHILIGAAFAAEERLPLGRVPGTSLIGLFAVPR